MDPLTHTLVGANLSATHLGEKTRFAAAALVIGANLPDIDGICYFIDPDLALGFRRGWTHGALALIVLPVLLTAALLACERLRPDRERKVDVRWLLTLSTVAIWSHPALDWLNTYGLRWLMPFSGRWFYGDAVYIMDVWLWLVLGVGYLAGRRASAVLIVSGLVAGVWITRTVSARSPEYLPLLALVASVFVAAVLWRRPVHDLALARRCASAALVLSVAYILTRLLVNERTEAAVIRHYSREGRVTQVMAGPHPIFPTRWNVVARVGETYRYGDYDWMQRRFTERRERVTAAADSPEWNQAKRDVSVRGLVTWLRFPAYEVERIGGKTMVHIFDARRSGAGRRATVTLPQ